VRLTKLYSTEDEKFRLTMNCLSPKARRKRTQPLLASFSSLGWLTNLSLVTGAVTKTQLGAGYRCSLREHLSHVGRGRTAPSRRLLFGGVHSTRREHTHLPRPPMLRRDSCASCFRFRHILEASGQEAGIEVTLTASTLVVTNFETILRYERGVLAWRASQTTSTSSCTLYFQFGDRAVSTIPP
jgi:hypothetical protein